jgi:hypothetical protein
LGDRMLSLVGALALVGCASVKSVDGQRYRVGGAAFRAYIEQVFRAQNRVADELVFTLEDLPAGATVSADQLNAADTQLLAACAGLNQLATSRRDAVKLGNRQALAAARTAPDCERAVAAAQDLLRALDP